MRCVFRVVALLLAVVLSSAVITPVFAENNELQEQQFQRDVRVRLPSGSMEDAIDTVQMAKIMGPLSDGAFHPEKVLTRADLASIIVKAFELRERERNPEKKVVLKDVSANHWASKDIGLVVNLGIMQGYRNGYFYPEHPVSRAEGLSVIAQAYGVYQFDDAIISAILSNYPDAQQIPAWARKAVATSLKVGLSDVTPFGLIRPQQLMTRGELAYILYQYLQKENPTNSNGEK
jgi:hypothetical protein